MNTLVIARLTFKEAARRKILLAALILGIVFLIVFGLGFHFIVREMERSPYGPGILEQNEISGFLYTAGLYVVNFLTVMMTVLTSVDTLSGEIQSGTVHTLLAKPVRRREIVLGKWLGFAGMISLYLLLMAGGITLFIYLRSDYLARNPFQAISMIWLNALLMLSITLFGGTFLSTLANGVLVFGLFGVAFIGGWIEQIGGFFPEFNARVSATNIGILTSLLMPSEALWKRAAYEVQSPLSSALGFSPFVANSIPSPLMIVYAGFYLLVILFFAVYVFKRRDL
jgi:ABC-type transport system involved in multi-copper enzyme maturation permease subunit